jgi:hypothetical protein
MPGPLFTNAGYIPTTVQDEVADLVASFLANVDGGLDTSPDQPIGQAIGIFAEKFTELTELGSTVYNALNPNAAEGQLLANDCALSGTYPQVATYSTVGATLSLNASTTVAAGATAIVLGQPGNIWKLKTAVTSTTAGNYSAVFQGSVPGPQVANAGTLTIIGTPTIGWTAVTNALDAVQGLPADTDTTLRQKRAAELLGQGSGDLDAIRAAVLKVGGVEQCFVFENTSMLTDATGLPAKSFRVVIWDGAGLNAVNNNVAQAIWDAKPSGILSYGVTASGVAVDSTLTSRTILFDRAVQVPIYIVCTTTPATLTTAGTAAVKAAMAAYAQANYNLGVSVIDLPLRASGIIPGVTIDVPTFFLGTAPSPGGTANIPISTLQIATLATTNILVNGV